MENIGINFTNVTGKIQELETYTKQNLMNAVEDGYQKLSGLLEESEGEYQKELMSVMVKEKEAVLGMALHMISVYELIKESSKEFETVDVKYATEAGEYLS